MACHCIGGPFCCYRKQWDMPSDEYLEAQRQALRALWARPVARKALKKARDKRRKNIKCI